MSRLAKERELQTTLGDLENQLRTSRQALQEFQQRALSAEVSGLCYFPVRRFS